MDPNATLDLILDALYARDWGEASHLNDSLRNWLSKGGFPPEMGRGERNREVTELFCRGVASEIQMLELMGE